MLLNESNVMDAIEFIEDATDGRYLLAHQAALAALGLYRNIGLSHLDICAPRAAVARIGAISTDDARFASLSFQGLTIRSWGRIAGLSYEDLAATAVHPDRLPAPVINPEILLESLDECPELDSLLEPRAFLAEILYVDILSDEALMQFHQYVYDL